MKRPYSQEEREDIVARICERLSAGESLRTICQDDEFPARETVFGWQMDDPEIDAAITRARSINADGQFEDIEEIEQAVFDGELKPDAARVLIDSIKWRLGKLRPKKYGDKVKLSGDEEAPLTVKIITGLAEDDGSHEG